MADKKSKSDQQTKQSTDKPTEGQRDYPRNAVKQQRKYDVDKILEEDYASDDPTEGRPNVTQGNRR